MAIPYRSAADHATEYIRDLVHSGKLEPDARVSIDELTAEMGISSTPVRDALKRLEGEGLVTITPRVGVYVRRIPPAEVLEVYAIKQALKPILLSTREKSAPALHTGPQTMPLVPEEGNRNQYGVDVLPTH